jgi:hypothetical protein
VRSCQSQSARRARTVDELARERRLWKQFVMTVSHIVGVRHA